MQIPNWYELVLLSLAAWRLWRLLAEDDIFDRQRRWLLRLGSTWQKEGDPVPAGYRAKLADFVTCPYCLGAHIAFWIYLFWLWQPDWTLTISVPLAISSLVVLIAHHLPAE